MSEPMVLKPRWGAFVLWPVLRTAALVTAGALPAVLALSSRGEVTPDQVPHWLPLIAYLLVVLQLVRAHYIYRRTSYELHAGHLLHHDQHAIFHRVSTRLPLQHITQITLELPAIQYRLFRGGTVMVHAAGQFSGMLSLRCISDPERVFSELHERLNQLGFGAECRGLLQEERPPLTSTILAVVEGLVGWALVLLLFLSFPALWYFENSFPSVSAALDAVPEEILWAAGIVAVLYLGAMMVYSVVVFVDHRRRVMRIWGEALELQEGWFMGRRQILPGSKITDLQRTGSALQRPIGVRDLKVSCVGHTGTIALRSLPNYEEFQSRLEDHFGLADEEDSQHDRVEPGVEYILEPVSEPSAEPSQIQRFRVHPLRQALGSMTTAVMLVAMVALLPVVVFALSEMSLFSVMASIGMPTMVFTTVILLVILPCLHALYTTHALTYTASPDKVCATWDLVTEKRIEFKIENLTSIRVRRDLFDRVFRTVSVRFESIGDREPIDIRHIPDTASVEALVRGYIGDDRGESEEILRPVVSLAGLVIGRLQRILWLSLFAAAGLVAAVVMSALWPLVVGVGVWWFGSIAVVILHALAQRQSRIEIYEEDLIAHHGWLQRVEVWIPYEQIRLVTTVKFPLLDRGQLILRAGHGGLVFEHLAELETLQDNLDDRLFHWPLKPRREAQEMRTEEIATWKPERANRMVLALMMAIFSCVGLPLLLLTPLYLIWNRAYYARASTTLETDRLTQRRGVFWRSRRTLLLNRVDQSAVNRGVICSLFNNGYVSVFVVGGGGLQVGPHRDYAEIDRVLASRLR